MKLKFKKIFYSVLVSSSELVEEMGEQKMDPFKKHLLMGDLQRSYPHPSPTSYPHPSTSTYPHISPSPYHHPPSSSSSLLEAYKPPFSHLTSNLESHYYHPYSQYYNYYNNYYSNTYYQNYNGGSGVCSSVVSDNGGSGGSGGDRNDKKYAYSYKDTLSHTDVSYSLSHSIYEPQSAYTDAYNIDNNTNNYTSVHNVINKNKTNENIKELEVIANETCAYKNNQNNQNFSNKIKHSSEIKKSNISNCISSSNINNESNVNSKEKLNIHPGENISVPKTSETTTNINKESMDLFIPPNDLKKNYNLHYSSNNPIHSSNPLLHQSFTFPGQNDAQKLQVRQSVISESPITSRKASNQPSITTHNHQSTNLPISSSTTFQLTPPSLSLSSQSNSISSSNQNHNSNSIKNTSSSSSCSIPFTLNQTKFPFSPKNVFSANFPNNKDCLFKNENKLSENQKTTQLDQTANRLFEKPDVLEQSENRIYPNNSSVYGYNMGNSYSYSCLGNYQQGSMRQIDNRDTNSNEEFCVKLKHSLQQKQQFNEATQKLKQQQITQQIPQLQQLPLHHHNPLNFQQQLQHHPEFKTNTDQLESFSTLSHLNSEHHTIRDYYKQYYPIENYRDINQKDITKIEKDSNRNSKRELLTSCIDKIDLYPDNLAIYGSFKGGGDGFTTTKNKLETFCGKDAGFGSDGDGYEGGGNICAVEENGCGSKGETNNIGAINIKHGKDTVNENMSHFEKNCEKIEKIDENKNSQNEIITINKKNKIENNKNIKKIKNNKLKAGYTSVIKDTPHLHH